MGSSNMHAYGKSMANRENVRLLLLTSAYSFVLLFFLSTDSYLYDLYYHGDSACFFMCGKAWMCGMTPYEDFADSKGPLLWLIYGAGYLLSHHSYVGVFWISVPFYAVTLFAAYKLCRLFVDKETAAISTAVLPLFLMCFIYHFEVLSEDFCLPFEMVSLYCLCRILKDRDCGARTYSILSALMGVCCACCMMIKYNIGVMITSLMAVVLYAAMRHKAGLQSLAGMATGMAVTAAPLVICFIIYGNMGSFIQEYFINTFASIENRMTDGWFFERPETPALRLFSGVLRLCPLLILLAGVILFCKKYHMGYWLVPCYLFFIMCLGQVLYVHYYVTIMPFCVFPVLAATECAIRRHPLLRRKVVATCLAAAATSIGVNGCVGLRFMMDDEARTNYYTAAYVMAQIKNPTVMSYPNDSGTGFPAGTLPACRYWVRQTGATEVMLEERDSVLRRGIADFICINEEEDPREIERCGYVFYCHAPLLGSKPHPESHIRVYGRPGLRLPPASFHVSQWDIWLKRNMFGI